MFEKLQKLLQAGAEVWVWDPHGEKYVDGWSDGFNTIGDTPTSNDTSRSRKRGLADGKHDRARLLRDDPHVFDNGDLRER